MANPTPNHADHGEDPKLSRIVFPARTVIVAALVVIAIVAAFLIGRLTAPDRDDLQTAATATISATAKVEMRQVDPELRLQGTVVEGDQLAALPATLPDQPIVTRQELTPGAEVQPGMFLGSVSGVPLFAMRGPLPLYRDLAAGDTGDDVRALQQSLTHLGYGLEVDGVLGWGTIEAVTELFDNAGYTLPTRTVTPPPASGDTSPSASPNPAPPQAPENEPVIPASAFLAIPGGQATVISAAPVSQTLSAEAPYAQLRTSDRFISARVEAGTAAQLKPGDEVVVAAGAATMPGSIANVGPYDPGGEGRIPGHDVSITSSAEQFANVETGAQVQVSRKQTSEPQLAVPVTAIRYDVDGEYVLTGDPAEPARVNVTVLYSAGGWAAVDAPELAVGDTVVL